ncbi:MAG: radical SAM protein [Proteiniphilum sp.]|jgi:sulfatase maturation enzyme AslB (radical SAM superfamily)|nr:radical SAM protein [Proteiniphilum sp.]
MTDTLPYNEFSPYKLLMQYDKLRDLAQGKPVVPSTLELDVSGMCNHNCRWCVDPPGTHSNTLMSAAIALRILQEARALGIRGAVFKGGGEPALHPELGRIICEAKTLGFETGVVTNGTRLAHWAPAYLEACDYVRISVDAVDETMRMDIHGVGDFTGLKTSISELTASRQGRRHPVIGLSFCLEYKHRDSIPQAIVLGEEMKVDYVLIRPVFGEEIGYTPSHTPEEAESLRSCIRTHAARHKSNMMVFAGDWKGDAEYAASHGVKIRGMVRRDGIVRAENCNGIEHITKQCYAAPLLLVITASLEVYFCCCTRGLKQFRMGRLDYLKQEQALTVFFADRQYKQQLSRLRNCECLPFCTHPLQKYNEVIEYLRLNNKYHTHFI